MSCQLGGRQPLSASATNIGLNNRFTHQGRVPNEKAKEMTLEDIKVTIEDHVHAARCAIEAGFDAVEIVSFFGSRDSVFLLTNMKTTGNGYLFDQFLNDKANLRTDNYGGSIENRSRFTVEVLDAVINAIGASRIGLRFSPFGTVLIALDSDPIATFIHVLSEVEKRGIAYVCLAQPRADLFLSETAKWDNLQKASETGVLAVKREDINLKPFVNVLKKTPKLATGGYNAKNCFDEVEKGELDAITFGKYFISNPDLVERIRTGARLTPWNTTTFYAEGPEGYTDYPTHHRV